MTGKTFNWAGHKSFALVLVALSVALAAIASAWFIELVLAVRPCPLCLEQRYAYYAAVPLALLLAVAAWRGASPALLIGGLALLAFFLIPFGLFHHDGHGDWRLESDSYAGAPPHEIGTA